MPRTTDKNLSPKAALQFGRRGLHCSSTLRVLLSFILDVDTPGLGQVPRGLLAIGPLVHHGPVFMC